MRLVTFSDGASDRAGALVHGGASVVDLHAADPDLPSSVIDLLRGGPAMMARARAVADEPSRWELLDRGSIHLHAPIPEPGKFLCIGYNYRGHGAGWDASIPEYPDVFAKTRNTVIGTDDAIRLPRASQSIDYEGELGVVLGARASAVSVADALDYVAGYTVVNDVSARDVQKRGSQWVLGKSFDTFGPMGPALVTPDEIPDPQALEITVRSNGTVTVRATTSDMIFPVAYLVSYLSSVITLEPGDVVATGTPAKIPEIGALGRFMQAGDVVEITYGAVGTLANRVEGAPG
jgi:2-keto-4-pentenoate hydratase/2-oxohepta-3-ene-1,7-dioic acid hydratase in catechol pathway